MTIKINQISALALLLPLASWSASAQTKPVEMITIAKGSIGKEKFESLGRNILPTADTELRSYGGYVYTYANFKIMNGSSGDIWQDSIRLSQYISSKYAKNVSAEILAMKMASDSILNSKNDHEISAVLSQLKNRLSFEQKIAFGSGLGGILLSGYDNARLSDGVRSKGIVTLREMITAHQINQKSGVCRDISVGIAQILTGLGTKSFVTTYQTKDAAHATVIVIDPLNPNKTYNINYDYVTSTEALDSTSHLKQDSTLPGTGTNVGIYSSDGRPLTELPTSQGVAIKELSGGSLAELDPMLRSENDVLVNFVKYGNGFELGSGIAQTPTGDTLAGFTLAYDRDSNSTPGRIAIVLYKAKNNAQLFGQSETTGGNISVHQKIYSSPLKIDLGQGHRVQMRVLGQIDLNLNISQTQIQGLGQTTGLRIDKTGKAALGTEIKYQNDQGTKIENTTLLSGTTDAKNVREGNAMAPYFRDLTSILLISQEISRSVEAFSQTQITVRNSELGSQIREEIGARVKLSDDADASLKIGYEGQIKGEQLAFLPGSRKVVFAEAGATYKKTVGLGGGIRCLAEGFNMCSYYGGGKLSLKFKPGQLERFLGIK